MARSLTAIAVTNDGEEVMDDEILAEAKGRAAQRQVLSDRVRITRRGILGALTGLGDSEFSIENIAAVRFKKAGFYNGFIQFSFPGSMEMHGNEFHAARDPNSVVFSTGQQEQFEHAKAVIEQRLDAIRRLHRGAPETPGVSELERLAQLKEKGLLTEEEFAAAKRKLLGL